MAMGPNSVGITACIQDSTTPAMNKRALRIPLLCRFQLLRLKRLSHEAESCLFLAVFPRDDFLSHGLASQASKLHMIPAIWALLSQGRSEHGVSCYMASLFSITVCIVVDQPASPCTYEMRASREACGTLHNTYLRQKARTCRAYYNPELVASATYHDMCSTVLETGVTQGSNAYSNEIVDFARCCRGTWRTRTAAQG